MESYGVEWDQSTLRVTGGPFSDILYKDKCLLPLLSFGDHLYGLQHLIIHAVGASEVYDVHLRDYQVVWKDNARFRLNNMSVLKTSTPLSDLEEHILVDVWPNHEKRIEFWYFTCNWLIILWQYACMRTSQRKTCTISGFFFLRNWSQVKTNVASYSLMA